MNLSGKTCVVTGAASGLGNGIAIKLIENQANVILIDIDGKRLNEFSTNNKQKSNFEIKALDVTDFESIRQYFIHIQNKYGKIDYLFNNAGIGGTLPFETATIQQWNKIINLNLFGVINGVTAVYPIMVAQKSGYIINTSSISGIMPFPGQVLYNTTKYGIAGLSLSLLPEAKCIPSGLKEMEFTESECP